MVNKKMLSRFWSKVKKLDNGCWEWVGSNDGRPAGYGNFWFGGRIEKAHRASYIMHNGPIPKGMQVLHRCDQKPCVRPGHLFLGTQKDNMADCLKKGRFVASFGNTKITPEIANEIYKKYATGKYFQRELAREYGVHKCTIKTAIQAVVGGNKDYRHRGSWKR